MMLLWVEMGTGRTNNIALLRRLGKVEVACGLNSLRIFHEDVWGNGGIIPQIFGTG
jgi:hypothetical protein